MAYLLKTDYAGRISMALIDILIAEDAAGIIAATSAEAESTVKTFCKNLYDIEGEFVKTDADRDGYILSLCKSIGLYFIYQRADDESIPEKVIKNYDDAMKALELISTGKKVIGLPPAPVVPGDEDTGSDTENAGTTGTGIRRMGSAAKKSHQI